MLAVESSPAPTNAYGALLGKVMSKIKSERPNLPHVVYMKMASLEMKKLQHQAEIKVEEIDKRMKRIDKINKKIDKRNKKIDAINKRVDMYEKRDREAPKTIVDKKDEGKAYEAGMKIGTVEEFEALSNDGKFAYISEVWGGVSSYDEFLKMNMEFVKGNIYATTYHYGPLCEDSVELSDDLLSLHKRRILTIGGQGMLVDNDTKQLAHLEFIMGKNDNTRALIKEIKSNKRYKWNIYTRGPDKIVTNAEKDGLPFFVTYEFIEEYNEWIPYTSLGSSKHMPNDIFEDFSPKDQGLNIEDYYQISISFKSFKETGLEKEILAMCDKCGIMETIE